jgi:hypothetical protein
MYQPVRRQGRERDRGVHVELDHSSGGADPEVLLQDRLKKGKARLDADRTPSRLPPSAFDSWPPQSALRPTHSGGSGAQTGFDQVRASHRISVADRLRTSLLHLRPHRPAQSQIGAQSTKFEPGMRGVQLIGSIVHEADDGGAGDAELPFQKQLEEQRCAIARPFRLQRASVWMLPEKELAHLIHCIAGIR